MLVALIFASILVWKIFPVSFIDGQGLTPFKRVSEYVVCGLLAAAIVLLWSRRRAFDPGVLALLLGATAVTILQELVFTLYEDPYGPWNFIGHCLLITAFFLLYKAIVETGFVRPVDLLFRDLQRGRTALESLNATLEERVAARTAEAELRAAELREMALELSRVEESERRRLAEVLHDNLQQLLVGAKRFCELAGRRVRASSRRRTWRRSSGS